MGAMESEEMAQCKAVVHSLLVSSSKPLTLYELSRDYQDIEGSHIPYTDLG